MTDLTEGEINYTVSYKSDHEEPYGRVLNHSLIDTKNPLNLIQFCEKKYSSNQVSSIMIMMVLAKFQLKAIFIRGGLKPFF